MGEMFHLAKENLKDGDRLINFASGHPSPEVFQDELLRKYISFAVEEALKDEHQYYECAGYNPLRESLKNFVNSNGNTIKHDDDLVITYGSTEAVYLTASVMLNPGDKVVVEEPSYVNAIKAFQLMGAEVISVRLEEDGVDLDALEKEMQGGGKTVLYHA